MSTGTSVDYVFAVDLGGTHIRGGIVDEKGAVRARVKYKTPTTSAEEIVNALVAAARECECGLASDPFCRAISVAVPGSVNAANGSLVNAPNLRCLNGFQLAPALARELGRPVIIENDANAAAVGEMWLGAARGYGTIVCLTLGTGVGGGIILDGKLWRGVDGAAAEIGHMSIEPFSGVRCGCGNFGCLEVYASATAVVRMTREAQSRFPGSVLSEVVELTSAEVYRAGKHGDELAIEVFARMGVYLGIGLASLVNVLNPEMIVITGGVVGSWDLFEKHMHEQVFKRAFPLPASHVRIVRAECGDDAGMLGAARLGFESAASSRVQVS